MPLQALVWHYREKRRCEAQPGLQDGPTNGVTEVPCRVRDQLVEQELIYEKLPKDIAQRHVLLMDPILATGNSAARAIQVCCSSTMCDLCICVLGKQSKSIGLLVLTYVMSLLRS